MLAKVPLGAGSGKAAETARDIAMAESLAKKLMHQIKVNIGLTYRSAILQQTG